MKNQKQLFYIMFNAQMYFEVYIFVWNKPQQLKLRKKVMWSSRWLTSKYMIYFRWIIFHPQEDRPTYVLPYGVPIWSLSSLYLSLEKDFLISIYWRDFIIFNDRNFLSPWGWTYVKGPAMGFQFDLFLLYIPFFFNSWAVFAYFWSQKFFISRRVALRKSSPYRVPIWSLSSLYLSLGKLFCVSI